MAYRTQSRISVPAGDAIPAYRLTTLLGGELALADAADKPLGVTEYPYAQAACLEG